MKSLKNLALLVLALTSVGGAILAWQQYQELVGLRASALNADERASLQKRIWDLERYNKELNDQLAALRDETGDESHPAVADGGGPRANGNFGGDRGQFRGRGGPGGNPQQMFNAMRDLMAKPEVQALLSVQQKAAIDARYASLFKSMNLSPEQAEKVKSLLADRQTTMLDVMAAARDQGIDPRTDRAGFQQMIANAQGEINNSLKAVLGEAGFSQLQNYEQTMPQRNVVNQLQQRLSYTDTPLSQTQADQLVQVLANNTPAQRTTQGGQANNPVEPGGRRGGPGGDMGGVIGALMGGGNLVGAIGGPGGGGGQTAPITQAAVNQAASILADPQVAALKQLQQQQQSAQQLQQIMRSTLESQGQNAGAKGTTGGSPTGTTGRRKGGG